MTNSSVALIELHDSRVADVRISAEGAVIAFEHLNVYMKTAAGKVWVQSWSAQLRCRNAVAVWVEWKNMGDRRIADGSIRDRSGAPVSAESLLAGCDHVNVCIEWPGGSRFMAEDAAAQVVLEGKLGDLEDWEGSLT
jgi:hypothetical protein